MNELIATAQFALGLSIRRYNRTTMTTPTHTVTLLPLGARFAADERTTLLAALEAAGLDMPSSCRNGTCRTCLCRLREGEIAHAIAWPGLSFDEKREGWILACVALARSDLVLDVPLARRVGFG